MRPLSIFVALLSLVAACSPTLPADPETGAPLITTLSLPDAVYGETYTQQVEWSGGQEPITFSVDVPRDLSWLSIDPDSGVLSGDPDGPVDPGVELTVSITDGMGQSDTRTLLVAVTRCSEEAEGKDVDCFAVDTQTGACKQGVSLCSNGKLEACAQLGASQNVNRCGTNAIASACGSCSAVTADNCGGTCKCGSSPACVGAVCCNGHCTASSSNDPTNCGGCGTVCPAGPANSSPTCSNGECGWSCNSGYSPCGASCIDLLNNVSNCGSCTYACIAPSGAPGTPFCSGGACRWYGTVVTIDLPLVIRSGPNTGYAKLGNLAIGATATIDCLTHGESIAGATTTDVWFHVIAGGNASGYASGAWINVGSGTGNIPNC